MSNLPLYSNTSKEEYLRVIESFQTEELVSCLEQSGVKWKEKLAKKIVDHPGAAKDAMSLLRSKGLARHRNEIGLLVGGKHESAIFWKLMKLVGYDKDPEGYVPNNDGPFG